MRGITKYFGNTKALDSVDLDIEKGEIHAILGEKGAGKSTLMNILYGLYSADGGEIYLNGNKYSDKILVEVIEGQDLINIDENLKLTALSEGSVKLRICMEDNNEIYQELTINIVENAGAVTTYQLIGDESLKWGRTKVIQSIKSVNGVSEPAAASFEVTDKDELLSSYDINSSSVTITANNENKTGTIIISCTFENGDKVEKEIRITSLWM